METMKEVPDRHVVIEEAIRRMVAYFHPEEIYLFGSAARGDDRPWSDVDFLVVLPENAPKEHLFGGIYSELAGLGIAVDVVTFQRSAFEERKLWLMSLPAIVLREGKLVYNASPRAA
jgi:predicted nucleotidyltransferase